MRLRTGVLPAALLALTLAACARSGTSALLGVGDGALPSALEMRQLAGSSVGRGERQFDRVWLADPTSRYPHPVFGSAEHAATLIALARNGDRYQVTLPAERVFEDIAPRVVDLDRDALEEILVVESDRDRGASLAVYGTPLGQQRLVKLGATPYLNQPYRWLNPVGAGDFDGDGWLDLALVETPHIGGSLVLYRYRRGALTEFARHFGVSTHVNGSTELGLARIVRGRQRDHLLVPDQSLQRLQLLTWRPTGVLRLAEWRLPARLQRLDPEFRRQVDAILVNGESLRIALPELE